MKVTRGELKELIAEEIKEAELDEGFMDMVRSLPGMGGSKGPDVWSYEHASKSGRYELLHHNKPLVGGAGMHRPEGLSLGDIQMQLKKAMTGALGKISPEALSIQSVETRSEIPYPFNNAGEVGEILRQQIDQGGDYGLRTDPFYKGLKKQQDDADTYKRQRKSDNETRRQRPTKQGGRGYDRPGVKSPTGYSVTGRPTYEHLEKIIQEEIAKALQGK